MYQTQTARILVICKQKAYPLKSNYYNPGEGGGGGGGVTSVIMGTHGIIPGGGGGGGRGLLQ